MKRAVVETSSIVWLVIALLVLAVIGFFIYFQYPEASKSASSLLPSETETARTMCLIACNKAADAQTCTEWQEKYCSEKYGKTAELCSAKVTCSKEIKDSEGTPTTCDCTTYIPSTPGIGTTPPIPDTTPPAQISLGISTFTSNEITLRWIAPGDDGNTGQASGYDFRYSTSQITAANWNNIPSAQRITDPNFRPLPAGQSQYYSITGLSQGTTYYFAIKAVDERGNLGPLSNVVSQATSVPSPPTECTGELSLTVPNMIAPSSQYSFSASGLSNCEGARITFLLLDQDGDEIGEQTCSVLASANGCSATLFVSSTAQGNIALYFVYLDRRGSGDVDATYTGSIGIYNP